MAILDFKGREYVHNHHLTVPYCPLIVQSSKGVSTQDNQENMLIHGDNLKGLKSLLPRFKGEVDVIYADPPYNTGNENWCYNDNLNSEVVAEWMNSIPIGINDGSRHDKWCTMMWPRLQLMQQLLHDDGLIFISIDDNEVMRLRLLMDEIFDEKNFIGQFVWKSRLNKTNNNITKLSCDHEYIVVYGKELLGVERKSEMYKNPDNDPRGPWANANMVGVDTNGNQKYDLINPNTGINYGYPDRGWRFSKDTMDRLISENRIIWPEDPDGRPRIKKFINEMPNFADVSSILCGDYYTKDGTASYKRVMKNEFFRFPKPPQLIKFLVTQHSKPDGIVLDPFAGSGTTGQAILELNHEVENSNRRFILIESEDYADEVTAERLRRVISGYSYEKSKDKIEKVEKTGGGFDFFELGEATNLQEMLDGKKLPKFDNLAPIVFHMATGMVFEGVNENKHEYYLGEANGRHIWFFYRPDMKWLCGESSALTLSKALNISKLMDGNHLVISPSCYVSRKVLNDNKLNNIEYVPFPFGIFKLGVH